MTARARTTVAAVIALIGGCTPSSPSPEISRPALPSMTAPFDLGRVVEQVHFAYRKEGETWTAGHSTYGVRVAAGAVEFEPRHFRGPAPGRAAPVRFGASEVRRGGHPLGEGQGVARAGEQGQLLLQKGEVVETLRNSSQGAEQTWSFEALPEGTGPLEVRVPVLEGRFAGATAGGLHFEAGALMVRYGRGTWVDSAGRRSEVPAQFEHGAVVLRVPQEVLAHSEFPAVLDPVIEPEFAMDAPVVGPSAGAQSVPAVASDGTGFLVVWQDSRSGGLAQDDIYAARVSAEGAVQDSHGIAVSTGAGQQATPAVAWNGTSYLVAWTDTRGDTFADADLYGARIGVDGAVLDSTGIAISTAAGSQWSPALGCDGTNCLVTWVEKRSDTEYGINAARVSVAGAVLDPLGIAISAGASVHGGPAAAWDGTNYLVVWDDARTGQRQVHAARVSAAGTLQDPSGIAVSTAGCGQSFPAVTWDGTNYLIVWEDCRGGRGIASIYAARVSAAGAVLDPAGIALGGFGHPAVAWNGTHYLVVWEAIGDPSTKQTDVYGTRISAAGAVLDSPALVVSSVLGFQTEPAIAWNGTNFLVAWSARAGGGLGATDIFGTRVTAAGAVEDVPDIVISTGANPQVSPAVGWDGTNYFVAWADGRAGAWDIFATRVGAGGEVLDPSGIAISTATGDQSSPAIAWDGANYLVVWRDARERSPILIPWIPQEAGDEIVGARVSATGVVQDPAGFVISDGASASPAVAWDGANYLVVWQVWHFMYKGGIDGSHIAGRRVSAEGVVQDPSGIEISRGGAFPAVAWDGTNHLVVWQGRRGTTSQDISGARVSKAGAVLDSAGLGISTADEEESSPKVAWGGGNFLVVWQRLSGESGSDIVGARVNSRGVLQGRSGFAISAAANDESSPAVAWDGSNYLVVWQDDRGGSSSDIYGGRVNAWGEVQDPSGVAISAEAVNEGTPAIFARGNRQALVAYGSYDGSPDVQSDRVFGRVVTLTDGSGCDCSSGPGGFGLLAALLGLSVFGGRLRRRAYDEPHPVRAGLAR